LCNTAMTIVHLMEASRFGMMFLCRDLPKDHGYPVRVVTPGITGARAVKWVKKISPARQVGRVRVLFVYNEINICGRV
jgi:Oxidoreductase molybdopterin binding domain